MEFRNWLKQKNIETNRGNSTTASDEVIRTGMQPQVENPSYKQENDVDDEVSVINSAINSTELLIPNKNSPKINDFIEIWKDLKEKWEIIKNS